MDSCSDEGNCAARPRYIVTADSAKPAPPAPPRASHIPGQVGEMQDKWESQRELIENDEFETKTKSNPPKGD